MSFVRGKQAHDLLTVILDQVDPRLAAGVHLKVVAHQKWNSLQRVSAEGVYSESIPALGSWVPFRSNKTNACRTATDAVEAVLRAGFASLKAAGWKSIDYDVRVVFEHDAVRVSFRNPNGADDDRFDLDPIPLTLLLPD